MYNGYQEDYLKMTLRKKINAILDFLKHVSKNANYAETMYQLNQDNFYNINSICAGKNCVHSLVGVIKGSIIFNDKEYIIKIDIKDNICTINGYEFRTLLERNEQNIIDFINTILPNSIMDISQRIMNDYKIYEDKIAKDLKESVKIGNQNFEKF